MSKVTQLASGQINGADSIKIELVQTEEPPPIVTWPAKPTVCHPHRFPDVAAMVAVYSPLPAPNFPASMRGGGCDRAIVGPERPAKRT